MTPEHVVILVCMMDERKMDISSCQTALRSNIPADIRLAYESKMDMAQKELAALKAALFAAVEGATTTPSGGGE